MPNESSPSNDPRLDRVIALYLKQLEEGNSPSPDDLLHEHPDLADSLQAFFADHQRMRDLAARPDAAQDDATIPPTASSHEDATLAPSDSAGTVDDATIPPSSRHKAPPVGTRVRYFGDYVLIEEIARGGMGVVYKARQTKLNRIVALKMILSGQFAGEEDVRRFHAEAEAAAQLDHPGIVPIFEVGEHEGQHYFSMAFVDGGSLADKIKDGPLPPREAAEYVKKVAEAVAYAHSKGVIHRDLKPGNILLDANGEPKVTDFGLAKRVEGDSGLTATGQILGTPSYMPPEQASGKTDEVTEAADVYSLGAILYACLTGRPPFQADSPIDTLMQVIGREAASPRQLNAKVSVDIETICLKCLAKEPQTRYPNALELEAELERLLTGVPIKARPAGKLERLKKWCKRHPAEALSGTVAIVALLIGTAFSSVMAVVASSRATEKSRVIEALQDSLYVADLSAAQQAFEQGDLDQSLAILNKHQPISTQDIDRREFVWRHLYHQCRYIESTLATTQSIPFQIAISSDNKSIAVAEADDRICVIDYATGLTLWEDKLPTKAFEVAFSPQDNFVGVACGMGSAANSSGYNDLGVYLFDLKSDQPAQSRVRLGDASIGGSIAFAHSSNLIACAGSGGKIELWDFEKRILVATLQGHSRFVESLVFTPDDKRLVSASYGGSVRIWDIDQTREERVLIHHESRTPLQDTYYRSSWWRCRPVGLAVSPDGQMIASAANGPTIRLWDLNNPNQPVRELTGHMDAVSSLDFSSDGARLFSSSLDRTVRAWNVHGEAQSFEVGEHRNVVSTALAVNDGQRVITSGDDQLVRSWKIPTDDSEGPHVLRPHGNRSRSLIYALAISPDNASIVSGGWVYNLPIQRLRDGAEMKRLSGYSGRVESLDFSPSGRFLAAGNLDANQVQIWDMETGTINTRIHAPNLVHHVSYSPDGQRLTMSTDGEVWIVDATSGERLQRLKGSGAVYSPDGDWMAMIHDATVRLIKVGDRRADSYAFSSNVSSEPPVFSHDGRLLAFIEDRRVITIVDVEAKSILHRISGHFAAIQAIAFSPQGRTLASVGDDGNCILWDVITAKPKITLKGHEAAAQAVVFSPDGRLLATAGLDGTIRIWHTVELEAMETHAWDILLRAKNYRLIDPLKDPRHLASVRPLDDLLITPP